MRRGVWSAWREPWDGPLGEWAEWVRELVEASGVYEIRERGRSAVVYVGESHTGKLYGTLTRHFQWWRGPTAGASYNRRAVKIRVMLTSPSLAKAKQDARIARLRPRDNVAANPDADVPF